MFSNISFVLKNISVMSKIVRELDAQGLTVDLRYRGKAAVMVGRQGHSFLDSIVGPVKIKIKVFPLALHVLKGYMEDDVSRD
ncbi:MAG: hypothetical protein ACXVI1_12250 [Halobacteriota archaeon]